MGNRYSIRQSDGRDLEEELVRLWSTNFAETSPSAARAKVRHVYNRNPAGSALVFTIHAAGDAAPVGVQSLLPRAYQYKGRSVRVGSYVDFVVDAGHRTLGPALMLFRRSSEIGVASFDFLHGSPNALAQPALTRAGARVIGSTCVYTKVQRSAHYLNTHHAAVGRARRRLRCRCCDPVPGQLPALARRCTSGVAGGQRLRSSIDKIWEGHPENLLLAQRTTDILEWRYPIGGPTAPKRIWLASDASGSPQGYVVWREVDGLRRHRRLLLQNARDQHARAPRRLLSGDAPVPLNPCCVASIFRFGCGEQDGRAAGFLPRRGGQAIVVKAASVPKRCPRFGLVLHAV